MGIDSGQDDLLKGAYSRADAEMLADSETEKLITERNIHSVYHMCPTHGTSCYTPLNNVCIDCRLYLSGADVRKLLDEEKQKHEDLLGDMKMFHSEHYSSEKLEGYFISVEDWNRIMDKHDPIRQSK